MNKYNGLQLIALGVQIMGGVFALNNLGMPYTWMISIFGAVPVLSFGVMARRERNKV